MSAYMLVQMDVDATEWQAEYRAHVPAIVERFGGRYLARTGKAVRHEGDAALPQVVALFSFPSQQAIAEFLNSPEYRPFREARWRGARTSIIAFDAL